MKSRRDHIRKYEPTPQSIVLALEALLRRHRRLASRLVFVRKAIKAVREGGGALLDAQAAIQRECKKIDETLARVVKKVHWEALNDALRAPDDLLLAESVAVLVEVLRPLFDRPPPVVPWCYPVRNAQTGC
jgi:hypothetical protein